MDGMFDVYVLIYGNYIHIPNISGNTKNWISCDNLIRRFIFTAGISSYK